jgi:hypothetical protein
VPLSEPTAAPAFRLAEYAERERILDFINAHFDWKLPLVNRPEWFSHYYCGERLQFALAEREGTLLAVAGYILANHSAVPDLWVSVWVAAKGENGVGLELMDALPRLTHARVVACNNIRANTCVFYRFLGWQAERLPHYYRLAPKASAAEYRLARPAVPSGLSAAAYRPEILPVTRDLPLDRVSTVTRLEGLGLPPTPHTPHKDLWYLARRYFAFPHLEYDVWSIHEAGRLLAYLVTRTVESGEHGEIPVLRIVDFIGEDAVLPRIGGAIDKLMQDVHAEYAECYCAGIPAAVWAAAGFSERKEGDGTIIPNYLTPPLYENTEYYYFTNQPDGFVLFKADGDQDRPNLPAED